MQKFCVTILLIALIANYEALPQNKWSRPISDTQGQLTRERRQFPFGEWIPLSKPCPTCRPLVDPLDIAQRTADIGLTPPRPPTVTRQVRGEGNFFPRDESSILSVPPPPPGTLRQGPNGNFQNFRFQGFPQQFNNRAPVPTQQVLPQAQQLQFLQQPFLTNQNVLVNTNQQVIPVLNNQNSLFGQENQGKQILNSAKVPNFNEDLKKQKITENIAVQQNQSGRKLPFSSKSAPFAAQQQQQPAILQQSPQQAFIKHHQQQGFIQQPQHQNFVQQPQHHNFVQQPQHQAIAQQPQAQALVQQRPIQQQQQNSVNFDSILTPPPVANASAQGVFIPGLDKEEVQLLYVPVETLRQRGAQQQYQQHLLAQQQQQNLQFPNRQITQQRPAISDRPTDSTTTTTTTTKLLPGSFITSQRDALSTIKVSSAQPFSTASTPSSVFFQSLPLHKTPQPFVSATPIISTPSPFVTQSSFITNSPFSQTFSTVSPTTLSHFPTLSTSVQFRQPETQFVTTPKTLISEEGLREEIITGKPQFESLQTHQLPFTQDQSHLLLSTGQQNERNPPQVTSQIQTNSPEQQFQKQQLLLKSQQEQQLLLQQQKETELQEEYLLKQRHQKELESQRLLELQRLKELEQQAFLLKQKKQKELEEQKLLEEQRQKKLEQALLEQKRQKEIEEERLLKEAEQQKFLQEQRQKELEQERLLKEAEQQKFLQEQRQKELEQERYLQQQRQKEIEQERYLQQQRQKEIEQERFLKQQRQKEIEQERYLQQQRQKEIERERFLKQQRQKEIEQERFLQEQKQKEMEEQLKIKKLKELDEQRLLQQQQKEQEEQRLLLLERQKELEEQRFLQEQEQRLRLQQEQQHRLLLQQNLQKENQQNHQKAQNFQFTQQQELHNDVTVPQNKHVFSETDNSNLFSQLEKETDPESLTPHQPPLSVFFKGADQREPKILDALRELRSSQTITVLDQYFEKMPKVFVGPAGLKPPSGYGKFELPYLSNIDNTVELKLNQLPFFVAPLNFEPPPGYSKIPFPSPHVGSVVISSESNPAMNLQITENAASVSDNDDIRNYAAVGPELPGLINGLEKEITTTFKPTTSSLPQTTAQLRNRRPNNSLHRTRKPVPKTRSTTTPKPEETTTKPLKEDSENGFRKPFNRFLKRRRPTTTTTTESIQEKDVESKQYSFQVQHRKRTRLPSSKPIVGQKLNRQNEHQGFDKISPEDQSQDSYHFNPDIHKINSNNDKFKEQTSQLSDFAGINNIQSFEDGPIPTGSAKSIAQELYRPNDLRYTNGQRQTDSQTKFLPKVDTTQSSEKVLDKTKQTTFFEDSIVNPTALYVETTAGKTAAFDYITLTQKSDSNENSIPTTISPNSFKLDNTYATESSPLPFIHSTTENSFLNDRFTVAFAEISKHHHIPSPQESPRRYEAKYTDTHSTPSHALQAPFAESLSQERQPQALVTLEDVKPTHSIIYSENINNPVTTSTVEFSEHFEDEHKSKQNYSGTINEMKPTVSDAFNHQHKTDYSSNSQNILGYAPETEQPVTGFANVDNLYSTPPSPTSPLQQYYLSSTGFPPQEFISASNNNRSEENYFQGNFEKAKVVAEVLPTQNYEQEVITHSKELNTDNVPKIEEYSQIGEEISSTTEGLKFSNPSIVKVRTRVRGRQRGNVNFAASQSTTPVPVVRTNIRNQFDNSDQEYVTKSNTLRTYNPVKTSKFNGFRGLKKPIPPTAEPTTEYDQKTNVFTIRPQKRPSNPSTVSTKRIRRPTSPIPTFETSSEGFGISTPGIYSKGAVDGQDYPSSGVSNDVYYEHANFSPIRQKFRKNQNPYEQGELKTVPVPSYTPTTYSPVFPIYSATLQTKLPYNQESYSQNEGIHEHLSQEQKAPQIFPESYHDSNLSESGIDISGIVLTTLRTTSEEESLQTEVPKKFQENKKAVEADLEKKSGRKRVRVRVNKRPHENFETAESQNLRTVANVLVPPTSTYKPNDENSFQQLAKNSNPSYGVRSREYFKKKLNLTHLAEIDVAKSREDSIEDKSKISKNTTGETHGEGTVDEHRVKGYFRKIQRKENEFNGDQATENLPSGPGGERFSRTKVRGFVRKIKKHGGAHKNVTEPGHPTDDDNKEVRQENVESHSRQHLKVNYGGAHQNGRFNGTRHKTIIKYIKKNRFRTNENESHEPETESEEPESKLTDSHSSLVNEEQSHDTEIHTTQRTKPQDDEKKSQTTTKNDEADAISTTISNEAQQSEEEESEISQLSATEQSKSSEVSEKDHQINKSEEESIIHSTEEYGALHTQRSDTIHTKIHTTERTNQPEIDHTEAIYISTTHNSETEKVSASHESSKESQESHQTETEAITTSSAPTTESKVTSKLRAPNSFRPFFPRPASSGYIRTREPLVSTTEHIKPETNERRYVPARHRYEKNSFIRKEEKSEEKKIAEHAERQTIVKNSFTPEIRKYTRNKNRENSFSSFSKNRFTPSTKLETTSETIENDEDELSEEEQDTKFTENEKSTKNELEFDVSTKIEQTSPEVKSTQTFVPSTEQIETTNEDFTTEAHISTTPLPTETKSSEEEEEEEESEKELNLQETIISTEGKNELPITLTQSSSSEEKIITTESDTEIPTTTEKAETYNVGTQPNLYIFGKDSFSFDETEKFTGTKNRAYVRNITTDILENTARFSAPGIDKQNEIQSELISSDTPTTTDINNKIAEDEKTEETTTELTSVETTTTPPSTKKAVVTEAVTKPKITKLVKTSTTTKISHETEICYRGKCIRTKSENPDEDLKLLVDSANISLEKNKT